MNLEIFPNKAGEECLPVRNQEFDVLRQPSFLPIWTDVVSLRRKLLYAFLSSWVCPDACYSIAPFCPSLSQMDTYNLHTVEMLDRDTQGSS